MEIDTLNKFRTRWLRWLGAMTRLDKYTYTELLSSDWSAWVAGVMLKNNQNLIRLGITNDPLIIREYYKKAIEISDMADLYKLDGIFCWNQSEKKRKRKRKH